MKECSSCVELEKGDEFHCYKGNQYKNSDLYSYCEK